MAKSTGKSSRSPIGIDTVLSGFMTVVALGPMALLMLAAAPMFAHSSKSTIAFQLWCILIVLVVLGTALLMARLFSTLLSRQIGPLVKAAEELACVRGAEISEAVANEDVTSLAERFDHIETVLAAGRGAALERIGVLEDENARMRAAAELQTRFFSEVSHEIRTPLSAIVSAARIIQRYHERGDDVVDRFGNTILAEGDRLTRLTDDLFDLMRIESGTVAWQDEELRPDRLVASVATRIAPLAKRKDVEFSTHCAERLATIWGDADRLRQVLEHLVRNAIELTPSGGSVELLVRRQDGGVGFVIRDGGPGIPGGELERVFDKRRAFADFRSGRYRAGGGLVLPLCREIVARHGGRIWARKGLGKGAEIHFVIPALAVPLSPEVASVEKVGIPLRVLLLTESSTAADQAVRGLRAEGIEARVCSRLQDLSVIIGTWAPQIVVSDPAYAWQLDDEVQARMRRMGVSHVFVFSADRGFVETTRPTHLEPLLAAVSRVAPTGARVLLVEDDKEYGSVIEFELTQAGYRVERVDNGVDAITEISEGRPDTVILDLALPRLDGFGVLEEIRRRGLSTAPLVLTALDDPELDSQLERLGAVDVFRKYELTRSTDDHGLARVRQIVTRAFLGDAESTDAPATQAVSNAG